MYGSVIECSWFNLKSHTDMTTKLTQVSQWLAYYCKKISNAMWKAGPQNIQYHVIQGKKN